MNIKKIKYRIAVATLVATAFCGCSASDEEIIYTDKGAPMAETAANNAAFTMHEEDAGTADKDSTVTDRSQTDRQIRIYVCGAVKTPGVYTLKADDRLVDAVDSAGGFTSDAGSDYLNLASVLSDGQKVYVPTVTEIEDAIAAGDGTVAAQVNITSNSPGIMSAESNGYTQNTNSSSTDDTGGKVDINSADAAALMTLPGVGQAKADKIIAYREANGAFSRIEDIMLVGGIKEGLFNKIKDLICVR